MNLSPSTLWRGEAGDAPVGGGGPRVHEGVPGSAGRLNRHDGRPLRGASEAIANLSCNGFVNSQPNWVTTFDCVAEKNERLGAHRSGVVDHESMRGLYAAPTIRVTLPAQSAFQKLRTISFFA